MAERADKLAKELPTLVPRPNGRGALLSGGVLGHKGGGGRPANIIRVGLREPIPVEVRKLEKHVREIEKLAAELDASYRAGLTPEQTTTTLERESAEARIRQRVALHERVMAARQQLLDYRAKYGLGTTITETDTKGEDVNVNVRRDSAAAIRWSPN